MQFAVPQLGETRASDVHLNPYPAGLKSFERSGGLKMAQMLPLAFQRSYGLPKIVDGSDSPGV